MSESIFVLEKELKKKQVTEPPKAPCYSGVYLDNSLDVVHDHGGFHGHTRHTHGKTSLPLKVIDLLK